jgi:DNA repair protein RadD
MKLRPYQQKLEQGLYDSWRAGNRNVVLVSPTGSGKTVVMGSIASKQTVPGCVIAHRTELVGQISMAMSRFGIQHNIIGPSSTVKFCISQQITEFGRKFYNPRGLVTVAAVDTLMARADTLKQWCADQRWWLVDECFPAGTLVDGQPIETIRVGDTVTAFNDHTGEFEQRQVTRLFTNPMPQRMVRVATAHHVVYATGGHPFWTQRGWVEAGMLTEEDHVLLYVRQGSEPQSRADDSISKHGTTILQQGVFDGVSVEDFVGDNGSDQSTVCFGTHDQPQPNAAGQCARKDAEHTVGNEASPEGSGRQRCACNACGAEVDGPPVAVRVCGAACGGDWVSERNGAGALQNRLCEPGPEDCNRGGWVQPHGYESESIGRAKGCVSDWQRLESVTILEQGDSGFPDGNHVYNIEVDGLHTYVAEGVVVHNCHHILNDNKWGRAIGLFAHAHGCGVTATPVRADRKSLHVDQGGVFHDMVIGPTMRELINAGSLCDYRIFAPPQAIDVSNVKIGANGDFSQPGLREAAHKSKIVGDVVGHYLKLARGLRGIVFTVDVEQAVEVASAFTAAGIPAMAVSAKTPDLIRGEAIKKFRNGTLQVLVNVDLFGEGFDVPAVEVVQMARPTMSYGLYVQQFGRALRPLEGKTHGIIIDHVGNVRRHGLPDAPRQWTLYAEERGKRGAVDPDVVPVTTCVECFAAFEAITRTCPFCGHTPEPQGRNRPEFVDGDLLELDPATLAQMRGEIERIDGPPQVPGHLDAIATRRLQNVWRDRQEAQATLRQNIALWAGVWRDKGASDSEIYRRFFFRFGTDIATAQALNTADAQKLNERIIESWQP